MEMIERAKKLHNSIVDAAYPRGWRGKCSKCGKPFSYTKAQCAYYLAHGWPKCECKIKGR